MNPTHTQKSLWANSIARCKYHWKTIIRGRKITQPPTFIVGCGHSGTSITLALLGAHSKIHCIPNETEMLLQNDNYSKAVRRLQKSFEIETINANKTRWIEKTPRHILHLKKIFDWYPDAKVLLIIRDGRDVATSFQARYGNIKLGTQRWVSDNLEGKKFWTHPNVHVFRYESLIGDPHGTTKDILNFLGEEFEEQIFDYHKTKTNYYPTSHKKPPSAFGENHAQYRNWQMNQPLFDGRGKWSSLSDDQLATVTQIAGDLLQELGYTQNDHDEPQNATS